MQYFVLKATNAIGWVIMGIKIKKSFCITIKKNKIKIKIKSFIIKNTHPTQCLLFEAATYLNYIKVKGEPKKGKKTKNKNKNKK